MVHSVSGWTRGVQVKLWDPLRMRAIPECLRGVFTTRRYTNTRLPYLYLTLQHNHNISAFCTLSCHLMPAVLCEQCMWNWFILWTVCWYIIQHSQVYSIVVNTMHDTWHFETRASMLTPGSLLVCSKCIVSLRQMWCEVVFHKKNCQRSRICHYC